MGNVLITEALFAFEIVRILDSSSTRERCKTGQGAVCIGQRFGISVRSQQIQAVAEAPFDLDEQRVVSGLTKILETAIRVDVLVLREGAQRLGNGVSCPYTVQLVERSKRRSDVGARRSCERGVVRAGCRGQGQGEATSQREEGGI